MTPVVEHLPSKSKALSWNPSTFKKIKINKKEYEDFYASLWVAGASIGYSLRNLLNACYVTATFQTENQEVKFTF
jgi:hypothetical protein